MVTRADSVPTPDPTQGPRGNRSSHTDTARCEIERKAVANGDGAIADLSRSSDPRPSDTPRRGRSSWAVTQPGADQLLNELPFLLTADEAAALLRTTRKAIYARAERGLLPGVLRDGRRLLVRRDDLLSWLNERRAASPGGTRR
jgi:excisionase family DNA binding protein